MIYNNRQPLYKPKVYPKRECVHVEIKDGVEVFVKGPEKNPFEGVDYHSLKLSSRIETGTFADHEGGPRKLEKAQGSDLMTLQIEEVQNEYEEKKAENLRKKALQRMDDAYNKYVKDLEEREIEHNH